MKTTEKNTQLEKRENELYNSLNRLENDLSDEIDELLSDYEYLDDYEEFDEMLEVFLNIVDNSVSNAEVNNIMIQNVENYLHIQKNNNDYIYKLESEEEAYKIYEKCVNAWDDARDKYFELSEECEKIQQEVEEFYRII